jgi:uncharacterized damage-inducible protein DinB
MRAMRSVWDSAVQRIPVERMEERIGDGEWSVKDEIGHVVFYDRRLAGRLAGLVRGEAPTHEELYDHPEPMPPFTDLDAFNQSIHDRYASMPAAEVVAAARRAFDDLIAVAETVPDEIWARPAEFTGGRTVAAFMPGTTWVHYARHLPPLEVFIARM